MTFQEFPKWDYSISQFIRTTVFNSQDLCGRYCWSWSPYLLDVSWGHPKGMLIWSQPQMHQRIQPTAAQGVSLPSPPPVLFIRFSLKGREVPPFLKVWSFVCVKVRPPQQSWSNVCFRFFIIYRYVWIKTLQLFPFHQILREYSADSRQKKLYSSCL